MWQTGIVLGPFKQKSWATDIRRDTAATQHWQRQALHCRSTTSGTGVLSLQRQLGLAIASSCRPPFNTGARRTCRTVFHTVLVHRVTAARTCALDIALYFEDLASGDAWMPWLFPVNSLRSRALLLARTPLVLVLDGDMLVHSQLHARLANDRAR
jgi:hypothetical protein